VPAVTVLDRLTAEALRANRQHYHTLAEDLVPKTRQALENLLTCREGSALAWLSR
jgi:hypothetical protein